MIPPSRFGSFPPCSCSFCRLPSLNLDGTQHAVDGCHVYRKISCLVLEDGAAPLCSCHTYWRCSTVRMWQWSENTQLSTNCILLSSAPSGHFHGRALKKTSNRRDLTWKAQSYKQHWAEFSSSNDNLATHDLFFWIKNPKSHHPPPPVGQTAEDKLQAFTCSPYISWEDLKGCAAITQS